MSSRNNQDVANPIEMLPSSKLKLDLILNWLFGDKWKKPKYLVNVLMLQGVIGKSGLKSGLGINSINEQIERAFASKKLTAICLIINSPGGSPVQSEFIANRIISLSQETKIPVYSFVEDVAASGGYWLACAGGEIYASKSSIIGSIGVVTSGFGFQEAISKLGIERRVYTQGNNKSVLDPFMPAKPGDIKIIHGLQKEIHEHFIDYVKTRRRNALTQSDEILFNGEFWTGQTALDYGLIDGIDNVYSFLRAKYGKDIKINYIETKQSWFKKKLGIMINMFTNNLVRNLSNEIDNKISSQKYGLD